MQKVIGYGLLVLLLCMLAASCQLFENVDADEIMVVQHPVSGELSWYVSPGIQWQGFGKVTLYRKLSDTDFDSKIMFNDNGTGHLRGKFQLELPLDAEKLTALHTKYGSQGAIEHSLVESTINKVIYMTGPLMSSKESSAERKTDLIRFITDQIDHGVYRTTQKQVTIEDAITKEKRTNVVADIALENGKPSRQEESALAEFGIKIVNFAPSDLEYDETVKKQIAEQQALTMKVQTARAQALEAEQRKATTTANGLADVEKAKYEKEVEKIRAVTEAQQKLQVATLGAQEAAQYKQAQILKGEGEGAYKRLVMQADGALEQKLKVYDHVMVAFADAVGKYQGAWVPSVVMGDQGKAGAGSAQIMEMFGAKLARDLALDMSQRKQ